MAKYTITLNGKQQTIEAEPNMPLLWALRDVVGLTGTKFGCGMSQCGACTVHLDGNPVRSCSLPVSQVGKAKVTTIEGLSSNVQNAVQKAWIKVQTPQCGYCQSGQIMSAVALLSKNPSPSDSDIDALDAGLKHFSKAIKKMTPSVATSLAKTIDLKNVHQMPMIAGAGAAGGLGFGAIVFLNAELQSGIDVILNLTHFDSFLTHHQFDWIITGEGKLDSQTAQGKVVHGVARRAQQHNVPVIALCGSLDMPISNSADETHFLLDDWGIQAAFSINPQLVSLKEALAATSSNLESMAFNVMRLLAKTD